ncbi:MAG: hypothetical protein ACP5MI_06100 [Candidatus Kryptoniota bacterium]
MFYARMYRVAGFCLFLITFLAAHRATGQITTTTDTFKIYSPDTTLYLQHKFILQGSEKVYCNSNLFIRQKDYFINYTRGFVSFKNHCKSAFAATDTPYIVSVTYRSFPYNIPAEYSSHIVVVKYDSARNKNISLVEESKPVNIDDFFGTDIKKNGSIVRGFTIGSNRDLTLNSGFRMNLSGKLTNDIEVNAALTDESTPIQPEGNTRTLNEFDKVYVTISSPHLGTTLGDFEYARSDGEFANISRKLQGAMAAANYPNASVTIGAAVDRGKFTTQEITPIDGSQGPYQLVGNNGDREIVIVAGTESVYLDGEKMVRGETNDYVIDYSNAQITFTPKHLITNRSRIVVDFEYSDMQYQRSFLGASATTVLGDRSLKINISGYQEADDPSSPIDISLSDSDKTLLGNAGGDQLKASRSGVRFAGRDSITGVGKGQYALDSLLVNGKELFIYRFVQPTDTLMMKNALYNVTFSYVGNGKGDYNREGFGQYNFVGIGQGSYLPIVILPMPRMQRLADVNAAYQFGKSEKVYFEYAASSFDANRLSSLSGVNTNGYALKFGIDLASDHLKVGSSEIGMVKLSSTSRFVNDNFTPIGRTTSVEFNREWGIDTVLAENELINQAHLEFSPSGKLSRLTIGADIGNIARGNSFNSDRYSASFSLTGDSSYVPSISYHSTFLRTRDNFLSNNGTWFRQYGLMTFSPGNFSPGFKFEMEDRRTTQTSTDSLQLNSYRFVEFGPQIGIAGYLNMNILADVYARYEDAVFRGTMIPSAQSITEDINVKFNEWKHFASNLSLTYRRKKYSEPFRTSENLDNEVFLGRWGARYSPLSRGIEADLFYQATTQRMARLQQIFWKVPVGQGQYIWVDGNHNGQVDITNPADFQPTRFDGDYVLLTQPTTTLYPVINLKTNLRIGIRPSRFITNDGSLFKKLVTVFSFDTYWRIEENNQTTNTADIYLLHLSKFLNDSLTIAGSNSFQQDIYVFENDPDFSMRFRFTQNKSLNQFAFAAERGFQRERSTRMRVKLSSVFYEQLDLSFNDNDVSSRYAVRAHQIIGRRVSSELSYRPNAIVTSSFTLTYSQNIDNSRASLTAVMNSQNLKVIYSFLTRGKIRFELERDEVLLQNFTGSYDVPFELSQGLISGITYLWQFGFDYQVNSFIQATASYNGRLEGGGSPVHTLQAEIRAFF